MEPETFFLETDKNKHFRLHKERIDRAKAWRETGNKINLVKIEEGGLEEHFEANWDKYHENYRGELDSWWKAYRDRRELTIVESKDGGITFVIDVDNMTIGKPEDTFYFPQLKSCWGVIVDIERKDREVVRMGYHQGGVVNVFRDVRDIDMRALVDALQAEGKVLQISIFYNGTTQQLQDIEATKKIFPPETPLSLHDMYLEFGRGTQDIYVTGNSAKLYHHEGPKRVFSGETTVFEAKV